MAEGLKVGAVYATLGLDSGQWDSRLKAAQSQLSGLANRLQGISTQLSGMGRALTVGVTLPLLGLGYAAIKAAGDMEQTRIALTTMLGSAERAGVFIKELQAFAAKTPFEFSGLVQNAKQLIAFGYEADQVIPIMTNLGNAVSSVGGSGETMQRIIMQLGQMRAIGKAQMEDIRPIMEAGINVNKYLAAGLGKSQGEIAAMIAAGKLSATMFIEGLMKGMAEDPKLKGMMNQQSKTFLGMWSNLKDSIYTILVDIGKPLLEMAKNLLKALEPVFDLIKRMATAFNKLSPSMQLLVVGIVAAVAAAGPLLLAFGTLAGAAGGIAALVALLTPEIAAVVAVIGLVAAGVAAIWAGLVTAYVKCQAFRRAVNEAWNDLKTGFTDVMKSLRELWTAVKPIATAFGKGALVVLVAMVKVIAKVLVYTFQGIIVIINVLRKTLLLFATTLEYIVKALAVFIPALRGVADEIVKIVAAMQSDTHLGTVLGAVIDQTKSAIDLANERAKAAKAAAKAQAEAEIDAIIDVIKKRREEAEERRAQLREAMGFVGVVDLWHSAMLAGVRGQLGKAKESTELIKKDVPPAPELIEIRDHLRDQVRAQQDLNILVRERLGVFA
jgi:tape measure domain-containing protein